MIAVKAKEGWRELCEETWRGIGPSSGEEEGGVPEVWDVRARVEWCWQVESRQAA